MQSKSKSVIITGVSRKAGIGFALAEHFLAEGHSVLVQSWERHDIDQPHGIQAGGVAGALRLLGPSDKLAHIELNLAEKNAPNELIQAGINAFGAVDVLISNHAASIGGGLEEVTAELLDYAWAVNARATTLLVQQFAKVYDASRGSGRVILFTSGQHLGPMTTEIPYAMSKAAVQQMTVAFADELMGRGITVNTVNPGPNDTGWAEGDLYEEIKQKFPQGRWGAPRDVVPVVSFLASEEARWVTGQTVNVEGGFRR